MLAARSFLIALSLCALPGIATASGWLQQPRECYAKLWNRSLFGSRAYAADGLRHTVAVPSYQDHLVSLYAECGLNRWVTAIVALSPAGYAKSGDTGTFYMGPLSAGLRVGLLRQGPLRLAAAVLYGYTPPVGNDVLSDTTYPGADGTTGRAIYQPAIENHFGQLQVELGYGFAVGPLPAYTAAELGVRFNSAAGVDHALLARLQFGVTFLSHLVISLYTNIYEPFFRSVALTNTAGVGQTRYLGLGLSASYWFIKALALYLDVEGVAYTESNAATPSLAFGLETRFGL